MSTPNNWLLSYLKKSALFKEVIEVVLSVSVAAKTTPFPTFYCSYC